jgi:hypothetical protein
MPSTAAKSAGSLRIVSDKSGAQNEWEENRKSLLDFG